MSEQTAVRTREKWVDDVKVIACILVVLGHFLASVQSYARVEFCMNGSIRQFIIFTCRCSLSAVDISTKSIARLMILKAI